MLDLHTHILPGIDDGADSWDEALTMAMIAVDSGTQGIVATSHGNLSDLTIAEYAQTFFEFQERLKKDKIPLMVYPGMEIFMTPEAADKIENQKLLTINNSRYTLVEFDFGEELWMVNQCLDPLKKAGYIPIIAHPERYDFVQRNPEVVYEWIECGYVIQANKGSFLGSFGRRVQNVAMSLLNHNLIHLIASDAHGMDYRTPDMKITVDFLTDYFSEEKLDLLFDKNPRYILNNERIRFYPPISYHQSSY